MSSLRSESQIANLKFQSLRQKPKYNQYEIWDVKFAVAKR